LAPPLTWTYNKVREFIYLIILYSLWNCANWTNSQPSLLFGSTEKAAWKS